MKYTTTPTIESVSSVLNLSTAHKMARKHKTHYKSVKAVDKDNSWAPILQQSIRNGEYVTSKYNVEIINDNGKIREISKLPYYPDRIVHWSIMLEIEYLFIKRFTSNTHAAIPGRGSHSALFQTRKYLLKDAPGTKYCLKFDIKKYFPHINHDILISMLSEFIKDKSLLNLIIGIIKSVPEDKGIPIGNYLSQYFANLYLSKFDHWIKEVCNVKYYVRYMDDIIIFGRHSSQLHKLFRKISTYLKNKLHLIIKSNWQVFKVSVRGIDYVGYRIFHNKVLLRKSTYIKMKYKCKRIYYLASKHKTISYRHRCVLMSYSGIISHATPKIRLMLFIKYIKPIMDLLGLKYTTNMIRTYSLNTI